MKLQPEKKLKEEQELQTNMGAKQSVPTLEFIFLEQKDAADALNAAEQIDNYRTKCLNHNANTISRRGQLYNAYNYQLHYRYIMEDTLQASKKHLPNKLLNEIGQVRIVILFPSADGGMPHTRPGNIICFPCQVDTPSFETIQHELWHIHQRIYPEFWEKLLEKQWLFRPWLPSDELPLLLEKQRRYNPDTLKQPYWIWKDEWVPVPIFQNVTQPTLSECKIWWYNAKTELVSHSLPPEVASFFGSRMPAAAYEHPYEMAAYMLSLEPKEQTPAWNAMKEVLNN